MLIAVSIAFFLMMLTLVGGVGYLVWARQGAGAAASSVAEWDEIHAEEAPPWLGVLVDLGSLLPASASERDAVRRELAKAGYRADWADEVYFGARALSAITLPLAFAAFAYSMNPDPLTIAPAVAFAGYFGYVLPEYVLRRKARWRRAKISRGLPDLLDLLVISIESGLSLDQAVAQTTRDLALAHPVISDELSIFRLETVAGASRAEALANLGKRTGEPEMRKLTSLLIQADRFGTSVAKVLRTQARYMRIRRRQKAEELAHKVGVKLIFPIFFLIMPSLFLVTAGPAVILLLSNFSRMVNAQ